MTRLVILLFLFFQTQYAQSQSWDWNQQLSIFSDMKGVFPTVDGKWVIISEFRKTSNNVLFKEPFHYMAIIDSSGTVWGEEQEGRIFYVDQLTDSTLIVAIEHFIPNDPTYLFREFLIKEDKLEAKRGHYLFDGFGHFGVATKGEFVFQSSTSVWIFDWDIPFTYTPWYFPDSELNDFIILGDNYYLSAGEHLINGEHFGLVKFYADTLGSIDTQWTALPDIDIKDVFQLSSGNILAISSTHIYKFNSDLELISTQEFPFLIDLIDLTSDGNSIFIVRKQQGGQPEFFEIDSLLHIVQTVEFGNRNVFPKNIEIKNDKIGIGSDVITSFPITANYIPSSFYLKVFQKDALPDSLPIDIKIENVTFGDYEIIDDSYLCHFQRSLELNNIKFQIKNTGTTVVDEFFINYHSETIAGCNVRLGKAVRPPQVASSNKFFNLNLQPGETTFVQVPKLELPFFLPNVDPDDLNYNFCFWASAINRSVDIDISDNFICEEFAIELQDAELWAQPITLFPNPINDFLQIRFNESMRDNSEVRIFNMLGQLVYEEVFITFALSHELDLTKLTRGNYFIRFSNGENVYEDKFVKY